MPSSELVFYYPEVPKPRIPLGTGYESRKAAHDALLAYHKDPRFPPEEDDYYFRGLADFLQAHPPNPEITESDLVRFTAESRLKFDEYDANTQSLTTFLEGLIRGSPRLSSTCPYRDIEATAIGRIAFRDTYLNIGGVGTNGGHEYTFIEHQTQMGMLATMIAERLVVAGVPVTQADSRAWESVEQIAMRAIEARSGRPYVNTPSCMDLSFMASQGAQEYAQTVGTSLPETPDFTSCLMHRMNGQAYAALGLTPLPQLGRKNCISACAEQNALMRLREAANVARLLPLGRDDGLYTVAQAKSHFVKQETGELIPATCYTYYVGTGEGELTFELKTATVDERLLWHPVTGKNRDDLLWIGSRFDPPTTEQLLLSRDSHFILNGDAVSVCVGKGDVRRHPEAGLTTQDMTPLVDFPVAETHRVGSFQIKPTSLHTTGLPCVYCTRAMIENRVGTALIEGRLDGLKGDDGLSLEWLASIYDGEVRFC